MSKKQLTPTQDKPWYCFDGDESEYFETEQQALQAAKVAIAYYLDEHWDEQVNTVQVGKVTHIAMQTNVQQRPDELELNEEMVDGSGMYWGDYSYRCDYEPIALSSLNAP